MQRGGSKQNSSSGSAHRSGAGGSRDVSGDGDGGIPDGWYRIQASPSPSSSNNAHPATPSGSAASASSSLTVRSAKNNSSGSGSLGLVRAIDPMRMLLRETRVKDKMMMGVIAQKPAVSNGLCFGPCSSAAVKVVSRESHAVRSSPRHLKLVQKQATSTSNNCTGVAAAVNSGARRSFAAAEAFSPQRSLRLASLRQHPVREKEKEKTQAHTTTDTSTSISIPQDRRSADLPLHELIQTVDDAVDADPHVDSNQAAITHLFMAQWLAQFDANRRQFKSIAMHAEVGFQELYHLTANLPSPNEFVTAFACKVLGDLVPHFGPYAPLLHVLRSELHLSAYASSSSSSCSDLPYFAIVKNQKRLVLALHKDKKRRRERNEFLAHEIRKVHVMFRHFLDECSSGLVRTLFREWYSIAVIREKNSKKYIEYFSAWFTGSARSLVPKLFATWKHDTVQRKMDKMQAQLTIDGEKLSNLQRQIDELSVQRDTAQIESLAIRNDRKQAEDMIQRLNRKIQSAGAFLEGSYRREGLVCQEGQLRVEAASFLPPLILESLLRGYHNVGFLQQLHNESIPKQQIPATVSNQTAAAAAAPQRKQSIIDSSGARERVHDMADAVAEAEQAMVVSHGFAVPPSKNTVLQDCLAEIIKLRSTLLPQVQSKSDHQSTAVLSNRPSRAKCSSDASVSQSTSPPPSAEISIQDFARLFQSIQQRMDARDVNVLFTKVLPATKVPFIGTNSNTRAINEEDEDEANGDDAESPQEEMREIAHEIASLYEQVIHAIRAQDEHYARNTKLFSSRMLESHEVSVVPQTQYSNLSRSLAGSDGGGDEQDGSQRAVTRDSLSIVPLQSGDLGVINGARRFSMANVCPVKMTAMNFEKHAPKTSSNSNNGTPMARTGGCSSPPSNAALERLEFIRWSDFGISSRRTRSFFMLFLAHLASEFGSLLFSPADMSAFMHNAYVQSAQSPLGKEPKGKDDQSFHNIVTAYEVWNRLAGQMIDVEIAQSRGGALALTESAPGTADGGVGGATAQRSSSALSSGTVMVIRPKLQFHIEPLPHGVLMTSSKEKETSSSSPTHHGDRLSLTLGETFHTARIRRLSIEDATKLTKCVRNIHRVVQKTSTRLHDFNVVRQQIRDFWHLQWEQASELAGQFSSQTIATTATTATAAAVSPPAIFTSSHLTDERKHVFECISFENPVIERIFSIEDNPSEELERVRAAFEKKKHLARHLYTKHRAHIQHAVSLDDLWHFVKVLRLPKEIHMLPAMRDEDMTANGFEQLFSPDDLAEILLQLCNEQFLPQITPLSARVEYFARHHLLFAAQNQSIIRELMHQQDVKRALTDHSQTIRIIFRRYCAKERDLGMLMASTNTNTHTQQASGNTKNSNSHRPARHTSHGITKYMRLVDWLAFIQDYNLLRPRFPLDYAVVVFRNVQEVASNASAESATVADEQLEMIYSEFCEALVGVAACFFPDPFLKSATKVSQFIQRFLPVSPEEVCSHV